MADWQSIPYDPCTDLSPYHHPDLVSEVQLSGESFENTGMTKRQAADCVKMYQTRFNWSIAMFITVKLEIFQMPISPEEITCTDVDTCSGYCDDNSDLCLHYTFDDKLCVQAQGRHFAGEYSADIQAQLSDKTAGHYICREGLTEPSFHSMCITIYKESHSADDLVDELAEELANEKEIVHSQALQLLEVNVYAVAVNKCDGAIVHGHQCYWIPNSIVTHRHCTDCPPICRSLQRSLTFPQFCIGAALLMVSIPIAWVPVAALISDRVHREAQVG